MNKKDNFGITLVIVLLLSASMWFQLFSHYDERIHYHADEGTYITNWPKYEAIENWYLFSCAMMSLHVFALVFFIWDWVKG